MMVNLDHVVMMSPQPGQSGKTLVELASGRKFWILNGMEAVSVAIDATLDGATVDAVAVEAADGVPVAINVKPA